MPTSPRQSPVTPKRTPGSPIAVPSDAMSVSKVAMRTRSPSVTRTKWRRPSESPSSRTFPGNSASSTTSDCVKTSVENDSSSATSTSTVPVPAAGRTRIAARPSTTSPVATRGSASPPSTPAEAVGPVFMTVMETSSEEAAAAMAEWPRKTQGMVRSPRGVKVRRSPRENRPSWSWLRVAPASLACGLRAGTMSRPLRATRETRATRRVPTHRGS